MNIANIGIDVVDIERTKRILASKTGSNFIASTYTKNEIEYCNGCPVKLSGHFAVKEAVYKALGTGWINGREVEVLHGKDGVPIVKLHGKTKKIAKNKKISASIAYASEIAIAAVVIYE